MWMHLLASRDRYDVIICKMTIWCYPHMSCCEIIVHVRLLRNNSPCCEIHAETQTHAETGYTGRAKQRETKRKGNRHRIALTLYIDRNTETRNRGKNEKGLWSKVGKIRDHLSCNLEIPVVMTQMNQALVMITSDSSQLHRKDEKV